MSTNEMSKAAHAMLRQAAESADGVKLHGGDQKKAARELEKRGLGMLNKSVTRLHARPAGRFVVENALKAEQTHGQ